MFLDMCFLKRNNNNASGVTPVYTGVNLVRCTLPTVLNSATHR